MTWETFGYICRKARVDCGDGESIAQCLARIEREPACHLYGEALRSNGWPRRLLQRVGSMQDAQQASRALDVYQGLNVADYLNIPMNVKRFLVYMGGVVLVLYCVVGIYQVKVMPGFRSLIEQFNAHAHENIMLDGVGSSYYFWTITVFLVLVLLIGYELKQLFSFNVGVEQGRFFSLLFLRRVRQPYLRLIEILQFPIAGDKDTSGAVNEHLRQIVNSGLCLRTEMQALIDVQSRELVGACEFQIKILCALVSVVVIFTIFIFLVGAYSPLFILGDAL